MDNGKGLTKLFIGGVHGKEGKTSIKLFKKLNSDDFADGQIYIYNFDESPYISTLKKEFYESSQGKKIISLIKYYNPDFYTEIHSYNLNNYKKLTNLDRIKTDGFPPCVDCNNHVLVGASSPLIQKNFSKNGVCQILELPRLGDETFDRKSSEDFFKFDENLTVNEALNYLKLISYSLDYADFKKKVIKEYPNPVKLAIGLYNEFLIK